MNLNHLYVLIFLFITLNTFGQNTLSQEEKIYQTVDKFVAKPTAEALQNLSSTEKEFWKNPKPKTKKELLAIVILNCNEAYYENQFNKIQDAVASYENAWKIYQKYNLSNYDIVEYCLKPLGNLYTILGDYDNAENTIKQYYYIATQEKNSPEASGKKIAAILNLSNVYQSSGKTELAIDILEKTIQTEKLSKTQKGILLNNLGNNYMISSKDFLINPEPLSKAEKCFKTAIKLLESEKNQSETLSNCYRNLASFYSHWSNFDKSKNYFEKAKNYFFATPNLSNRKIAKFKYEEASLLFKQQKLEESNDAIASVFKMLIPNYFDKNNSLPNQSSLYAETVLLDALDLQAEIYSKQNQPKKALEAYTLAFHIEDFFADLMVYENSKIINQTRVRNRTEKCLAIYDFLFQKEHKQSYIDAAFQLAEQSKSGVLKNYLLKNKTASRTEKLHIEQLQNWTNEILKEQQKGELADIPKINKAIQKQNDLMLSLKKLRSEDTEIVKDTIDLKALLAKLKQDHATMIEYFLGYENMYIFTTDNKKIKLNHQDITDTAIPNILMFLDYFSNSDAIANNSQGYNQMGYKLFKMLQLPRTLTQKNLIIIPDGILNFLPFEALITKESSTTNFASMHYLINSFTITYNNSASFYLDTKPLAKENKRILGIFPVFENTDYTLRFSKNEMQSIQKNFEGKYFENVDATFQNFKNNAADYSILHLSTHAAAGDIDTPASIKFYDQEILYSELYNLHINPDLVVLSACETGLGKLYKSEGAMSIARGFQFAGTQNLLFSLWKVNDFTTSVLMDNFYQNIKNNLPFFEANRQAKLDYLNNKDIPNAKKSPYYWSAFVYYGTLEKNEAEFNYWYLILGIVFGIALIWLIIRFRK